MKTEDLTLEMFKDYVLENILDSFNFQEKDEYYKERYFNEDLEMFKGFVIEEFLFFKRLSNAQNKRYKSVTFRLGIKQEDIDEIDYYFVKDLFTNFIKTMDLQDLDNHVISFGYYSSQDFEFELTLSLYIK